MTILDFTSMIGRMLPDCLDRPEPNPTSRTERRIIAKMKTLSKLLTAVENNLVDPRSVWVFIPSTGSERAFDRLRAGPIYFIRNDKLGLVAREIEVQFG